jgi:hypothetical protein
MSNINVNNLTPLLGSGSSVSVSGSLVVKNDVTIGGHLYIGDQDTDSVTFSAEVSSSITPDATITYDLGTASKQWRSIYLDSLVVKHITASGNISASGTGINGTGSFGHVFVSGSISASGNIGSEGTGSFFGGVDAGFNSATGSFGYISASSDISTSADIYAMDAYLGDDLWLKNDDAVILMGLDMDYSIKHDSSATSITHNVTGSYVVNASTDVILDTHAGNIYFKDCGVNQLLWDLDGTSGEVIAKLMVDGDDLVFKQFDGTEVLRLDDDGDVKVFDDLRLTSDSSVFAMGVGNDFTITHDGTTGATLAGNPITIDSAGALNLFGTSINIGTDTDVAIDIDSAALDIDASGAITIDSTSTISIDGADDMNFTITSSTDGEDLTIQQIGANDSSINITAAGTGADAINIDATAGDMRIAPSLANEKTLKLGKTGAVQMVFSPHGTAASEKISIINTGGTDDEAIKIDAVAGGLLLAAGNDSLHLDADGIGADALNIDSAGGIDIDAQGVIAIDSTSTITVSGDGGATFGDDTESLAYDGSGNLDLDAVALDMDMTATSDIALNGSNQTLQIGVGGGGTNKLTLLSAGTGANALRFQATAGGLDIDTAGAVAIDSVGLSIDSAGVAANITSTTDGDAEDFTIALAGATDSSLILSSTGTGADALQLFSSAGGIDITANGGPGEDLDIHSVGSVNISSEEAVANAIYLNAAPGGIDIDAGSLDIDITGGVTNITSTTDGAAEDLTIALAGATDSSLVLSSTGTGADALQITTTAGGIDISATGNAAGEDIDISSAASVNVTATEDAANAIYLRANGGTSETIKIHSDQGTGAGSIELTSDAGGIDVNAAGAITIDSVGLSIDNAGVAANITSTTDGDAEDFTIALAGATDSSLVLSSTGTGADALQISTSAGGIDITATGNAAGEDIDISSAASINLTATENAANAILLTANGGTSETIKIHSDQGTAATSLNLLSDAGGITISAGNTTHGVKVGDVSGAPISIGHTTSETTVNDNLTVTGNTTVQSIKVNGGLLRPVKTITSNTTLDDTIFKADAGKMIVLNAAAGAAVILPAATGTGAQYNFFVGTAITSNSYTIKVADATDTFIGAVHMMDADDDSQTSVTAKGTDDTLTMNGGTTGGGLLGDHLIFTDIATNKYVVQGNLIVPAGSNPADPFSATVS